MKKHIIWMIVGCTVPLLLIFFAPMLGLGSGASLFIFVIATFACHLLMPMHQDGGHREKDSDFETSKTKNHANH